MKLPYIDLGLLTQIHAVPYKKLDFYDDEDK